jgi:hypothetical protein
MAWQHLDGWPGLSQSGEKALIFEEVARKAKISSTHAKKGFEK